VWFWLNAVDDGTVWYLNATTYSSGWQQAADAVFGGFGRKVFIRGGAPLSGCWFSTDFDAEDTWTGGGTFHPGVVPSATSMNAFATASSGKGPWTTYSQPAPWAPRASAALTSSWKSTSAFFASGMTFNNGVPSAPVFADVWQIDVGVCLLAPSTGAVCNGNGQPDLVNVVCNCVAGTSGQFCEVGSPASNSVAGAGGAGPAVAVGVSIAVIAAVAAGAWFFVAKLGGTIPGLGELASLAARLGGGKSPSRFAPRVYAPVGTSSGAAAGASSGASPGYGAL
jgi:hypothetical protein